MRTRFAVVVLGSGLAIAFPGQESLLAQQNGTVTFTTRNGQTMVEQIQGNRIRLDMGGKMSVILDGQAGTITSVLADRQMYMQMPATAATLGGTPPAAPTSTFTVTQGGTETIAGETCTDYVISGVNQNTGKSGQGMVCATTGLGVVNPYKVLAGTPMGRMLASSPQAVALAAALNQMKGQAFLKASGMNGDPNEVEILVTKIDPSTPPESAFQPPAGYTKMQMPMGAMGGAGMGGMPPGKVPAGAAPPQ